MFDPLLFPSSFLSRILDTETILRDTSSLVAPLVILGSIASSLTFPPLPSSREENLHGVLRRNYRHKSTRSESSLPHILRILSQIRLSRFRRNASEGSPSSPSVLHPLILCHHWTLLTTGPSYSYRVVTVIPEYCCLFFLMF